MKTFVFSLTVTLVILGIFFTMGFILPMLISAQSDTAVAIGALVIVGSLVSLGFFTVNRVKQLFNEEKKDA